MSRNFDDWMSEMKDTISTWDYYVDFEKVYRNTSKIKVELNILNSLIGSENIEADFIDLLNKYPEILKVIPILLAKREKEIRIIDVDGEFNFNFSNPNYTIDEYCMFMKNTGIFGLLEQSRISDLTDYVKGVETGMDTNARKNRTGHTMENLVEGFIKKAGFISNINYFKEMTKSEVEFKFGINLSTISNKGKSDKRFDFVVKTEKSIYAIETNFYSGGGSKLNETARSYELLARQSFNINGFTFIWVTDGRGWNSAKNNLRQTFDVLDNLYNIKELELGKLSKVLM